MVPDFPTGKIEKVIRDFHLKRTEVVDPQIEWRTKAPPFVESFYGYIKAHGLLPTQNEFVDFYVERNREGLASLDEPRMEAIKARAARAFPSFIRKMHFRSAVQESGLFEAVDYDPDSDMASGVDAFLSYRDHRFAVRCVSQTKRPRRRGSRKPPSGSSASDAIEITLAFNRKRARKVGEFYLCTQEDIDRLRDQCDKALGHTAREAAPTRPEKTPAARPMDVKPSRDSGRVDEPRREPALRESEHGEIVDWDEHEPAVETDDDAADDDVAEDEAAGEPASEGDRQPGMLGKIRRLLKRKDGNAGP